MRSGAGAGGFGVVVVAKGVGEQQVDGQEEEEEKGRLGAVGAIPHDPGHLLGLVSPSRTCEL